MHHGLPRVTEERDGLGTYLLTSGNTWLAGGNLRGTTHNTQANYNTFMNNDNIMSNTNTARTSTQ